MDLFDQDELSEETLSAPDTAVEQDQATTLLETRRKKF